MDPTSKLFNFTKSISNSPKYKKRGIKIIAKQLEDLLRNTLFVKNDLIKKCIKKSVQIHFIIFHNSDNNFGIIKYLELPNKYISFEKI